MFRMEFNTDNAAFGENAFERRNETVRILENIVTKILCLHTDGSILDHNGNVIGHWRFDEEE